MSNIRKQLNNIGIKKKLWFMNVFGVMIPVIILFAFLFNQIYAEYNAREEILIEESMNRIKNTVTDLFSDIENITYMYVTDNYLNTVINQFNGE